LFLQDVLVVTAPGSGAEIIPFLKTWVNLPMAIGFTILYAKVSRFEAGSCFTAPAQLQQQAQHTAAVGFWDIQTGRCYSGWAVPVELCSYTQGIKRLAGLAVAALLHDPPY
jgi:hypothetical protein